MRHGRADPNTSPLVASDNKLLHELDSCFGGANGDGSGDGGDDVDSGDESDGRFSFEDEMDAQERKAPSYGGKIDLGIDY